MLLELFYLFRLLLKHRYCRSIEVYQKKCAILFCLDVELRQNKQAGRLAGFGLFGKLKTIFGSSP